MADDHKIPEGGIEERFLESYKRARESFKDVCPTQADQDKMRKTMQGIAEGNYQAFATLAKLASDDGNTVPLIMAAIESKNLAREVFAMVFAGMAAQKDPGEIIGELGARLLHAATGPLNMTLWEKFQQEQIEEVAAGKV